MFNKMKYKFLLLAILFLGIFLRFYCLDSIPPSLYSDEVSQGYNAFSLLKTGRDEHGIFLPISLRSFGDWKPPLPTYLMIPPIFVFGLKEYSVRFPSAIFGTLSIYLIYLISNKLFQKSKYKNKISLLAAFIISVSPWHIFQSRTAMLVIISLFFILLGIYFFIKNNSEKNFYLGTFYLGLSIYAYYGARVIVPLLAILLLFYKKLHLNLKALLVCLLIFFLVIFPLFKSYLTNSDVVLGRAKTVSVLYDKGPQLRLWELISQDGVNSPIIIARFFHNKTYLYSKQVLFNFFQHFDFKYLLFEGDLSQPFNTPGIGIIYILDGIFLLVGFYFIFREDLSTTLFLLLFLIISIIPAALTFMVPSSNRTFNLIFPFSILIALGLIRMTQEFKSSQFLIVVLSIIYTINISYFLNIYFKKIPLNFSNIWNYGWKETVDYVNNHASDSNNIIISSKNGMPYIYFLFYNHYDPSKYQKIALHDYSSDRFGFENVDSFDKYYFSLDLNFNDIKSNHFNNSLYIVPVNELPENERSGEEIKYKNGKTVLRMFKYD